MALAPREGSREDERNDYYTQPHHSYSAPGAGRAVGNFLFWVGFSLVSVVWRGLMSFIQRRRAVAAAEREPAKRIDRIGDP